MTQAVQLQGLYVGQVAQRYGFDTAIEKSNTSDAIYLSKEGLVGDECADKKHHGGLERALHQYPAEHYQYWHQQYKANMPWQSPGMGENLSTIGMTESNVCIGDQYQWGDAVIEVSQPRSPCFKLNKRWGVENLSVEMQNLSLCGWLYRVLQPGLVSVSEPLILIHREDNSMTVKAVCELFFGEPLNKQGLLTLKQQHKLSHSWISKIDQRLASNTVENWSFRLLGRAPV